MTEPSRTRERQRIDQIARDYEGRGYQVFRSPALDELLPGAPAGFRPALVAQGRGENVIIEVTDRSEALDRADWTRLQSLLTSQPGWRFELILLSADEEERFANAVPFDPGEVERVLDEACRLSGEGYQEAAILRAWSAAEGALRLVAERNALDTRAGKQPSRLLEVLAAEGIIDPDEHSQLAEAMTVRNGLVHGFVPQGITPDLTARLVGTVRQIAHRETASPAA